jgi:hypothetical protein
VTNVQTSTPKSTEATAWSLRQIFTRLPALAPVALGALTTVGLLLLLGRYGYDDPYITYRYADNLVAGNGLVYNVGQQTLSTTTPFYAVLLAGLSFLWRDMPRLSNCISVLSTVAAAALLATWAQDPGQRAGGMIAGLLLSVWPLLLQTTGSETCLFLVLVLAGLYAAERSRPGLAAAALALATIVRPEGLLAALAAGLVTLTRQRSLPWKSLLLYLGLVAAWYGGLWLTFGSPLPVTLAAKRQQASAGLGARFEVGFLRLLRQYSRQPLYWLHAALALLGLTQVVVRARHWVGLLVWTAFYFAGYSLLGVNGYFWYYAPLIPAATVLMGEGVVAVVRGLARLRLPRPALAGVAGLLVASLLAIPLVGALSMTWRPDVRLEAYREIGEWLQAETPAAATVGALEVGIIGYYSKRPMIDFAGLIQPDVAEQLDTAGSYGGSAAWAIQQEWPDYVVLQQPALSGVSAAGWFRAAYVPERQLAGRGTLWMTVYRRTGAP